MCQQFTWLAPHSPLSCSPPHPPSQLITSQPRAAACAHFGLEVLGKCTASQSLGQSREYRNISEYIAVQKLKPKSKSKQVSMTDSINCGTVTDQHLSCSSRDNPLLGTHNLTMLAVQPGEERSFIDEPRKSQ